MASIVVARKAGRKERGVDPADHMDDWYQTIQVRDKISIHMEMYWPINNTHTDDIYCGCRIQLNHRDFFRDTPVVEYETNRGLLLDEIGGGASRITPPNNLPWRLAPGVWLNSKNQGAPFWLVLPGMVNGRVAGSVGGNNISRAWWNSHENSSYNLNLELFELPSQLAKLDFGKKVGEHEFKEIAIHLT